MQIILNLCNCLHGTGTSHLDETYINKDILFIECWILTDSPLTSAPGIFPSYLYRCCVRYWYATTEPSLKLKLRSVQNCKNHLRKFNITLTSDVGPIWRFMKTLTTTARDQMTPIRTDAHFNVTVLTVYSRASFNYNVTVSTRTPALIIVVSSFSGAFRSITTHHSLVLVPRWMLKLDFDNWFIYNILYNL